MLLYFEKCGCQKENAEKALLKAKEQSEKEIERAKYKYD